jgi:hypothetical protein
MKVAAQAEQRSMIMESGPFIRHDGVTEMIARRPASELT